MHNDDILSSDEGLVVEQGLADLSHNQFDTIEYFQLDDYLRFIKREIIEPQIVHMLAKRPIPESKPQHTIIPPEKPIQADEISLCDKAKLPKPERPAQPPKSKKKKKVISEQILHNQPPTPTPSIVTLHGASTGYNAVRKEDWRVRFTNEFWKDVSKADRTLQGQVLAHIQDILSNPLEVRGDTNKPLTANYKGMWRHRIGDNRIIYRPDASNFLIEIIAFSCRGSVY